MFACVLTVTEMNLARLTEGLFGVGPAGLITNQNLGGKFSVFFKGFFISGDKENIPKLKNNRTFVKCS
jgi:hypothetical protein